MGVIITIIVWLLLLVAFLIVILVVFPFHGAAAGAFAPWHATGLVEIRWGWGFLGVRLDSDKTGQLRLFGFCLYRFELESDPEKKEAKKEKKEKKRAKKKKARKRGVRWAYSNKQFFYRLITAFHVRGVLRGTVGLGDPADTAQMAMLVQPALEQVPALETRLTWDYVDEVLVLEGAIQARIWPLEFAYILLATILRRESRRALMATS